MRPLLVDWVKAFHLKIKNDVYKLLDNDQYIGACRDIAYASKHISLNLQSRAYKNNPPVVSDVESSATHSASPSSIPSYRLKIQFKNGNRLVVEDVANKAIDSWDKFFKDKGIG